MLSCQVSDGAALAGAPTVVVVSDATQERGVPEEPTGGTPGGYGPFRPVGGVRAAHLTGGAGPMGDNQKPPEEKSPEEIAADEAARLVRQAKEALTATGDISAAEETLSSSA